MVETLEIIRRHSRWRIGDGNSVKIWGDKWLPDRANAMIQTPPFPFLQDAPVSALFNEDNSSWDEEVIRDIFVERDVDLILSIPLPLVKRNDKLIWNDDRNGSFTVKGCYRDLSIQFDQSQRLPWTTMWNLNVPRKIKSFVWQACSGCLPTADRLISRRVQCPAECQMCQVKEENTIHLFTECDFAKSVWSLSGLPLITHGFNSFAQWLDLQVKNMDKDNCCLLLMLCWKMWTARNGKIWNGRLLSPSSIVEGTKRYLSD